MPQPLYKLVKPGTYLNVRGGLPVDNPALCAQAMNVIALWALVERDLATFVVSIVPGKGPPIAQLLIDNRADSPKRAVRNALAASFLDIDELPIFDAMMVRYDACFKLRNPLAHWGLGVCKQVPNAIVAINPEDYIKIGAANELLIDQMIREMADPAKAHLKAVERISEETASELKPVHQKYAKAMLAYRPQDLKAIEKEIDGLLYMIRQFRVAIRLKHLKLADGERCAILRRLSEKLGLFQPKGP